MTPTATVTHLLQTNLADMRAFYEAHHMLATSTNADTALIRSHIAYWSGTICASEATVQPSRGHSYRVKVPHASDRIVKIVDHYDHRDGITGWN